MKPIKMTLLAATAAVAAMAFIGASMASATPPWIGVCKNAELLKCANLVKHPLLGDILALASEGTFKGGFEITCKEGMGLSNQIESQQNGAFKGNLISLTFEPCSGGCEKVTVITPIAVEINMETEATESWRLKAAAAKVAFSKCTFGVECEFEGNLNLKLRMDALGAYTDPKEDKEVDKKPDEFKLIKGSKLLCGEKGTWESGRTRFDWVLDDVAKTTHVHVTPSLIGAKLIPVA
jgi:hypothetical protein